MNRTWKDAACEVAWNWLQQNWMKTRWFCIEGFLNGVPPIALGYIKHKCDLERYNTFNAFRAAFMKWLEDNEANQ